MGIRINGIKEVHDYLLREIQKEISLVVESLDMIGLETVKAIRDGEVSNWDDKSGNLRSSIGYIIVVDGKIVNKGGFEAIRPGSEEGGRKGYSFASQLAPQYPKGFALIVVAGMEYASYVEKVDSKTVLAGGELFARKKAAELAKDLSLALKRHQQK